MFGQHSSASTGGIVIRHSKQIANISAIVCWKFGATPPYDRRWRGVVMVLQVCEQIFTVTLQFVHVAIFHLWFLLERPNNWYTLRYVITAHVSHFWKKLAAFVWCYISLVRTLMFYGQWHFGSSLANGWMLRGESHYSSNDGCGLHWCAGRGMVVSSVQK